VDDQNRPAPESGGWLGNELAQGRPVTCSQRSLFLSDCRTSSGTVVAWCGAHSPSLEAMLANKRGDAVHRLVQHRQETMAHAGKCHELGLRQQPDRCPQ